MKIRSFHCQNSNQSLALKSLTDQIERENLKLIIGTCSPDFERNLIFKHFNDVFEDVKFHINSSALGVMNSSGFYMGNALTCLAFYQTKNDESFGVGHIELSSEVFKDSEDAIQKAIESAGRKGEMPSAIWLTAAPGNEETIIAATESVIGSHVPIVGGSSADNEINGNWFQVSNDGVYTNSILLSVIFSDAELSASMHSPFNPTNISGLVTKSHAREIIEIDNQPAAQVYNKWTQNSLSGLLGKNCNILKESSLYPLGRVVEKIGKVELFQISHPESITAENSISLFTNISDQERVFLMQGSVDDLISRSAAPITSAMRLMELEADDVEGVLMTFCAGCMMTIGDQVKSAQETIIRSIGKEVPLLCSFTFGEQGQFWDGKNIHGNLMYSALVISNKES